MENLIWHKSSRSNGSGGDCIECAEAPSVVFVRDSKDTAGPVLTFTRDTWSDFIESVKNGQYRPLR